MSDKVAAAPDVDVLIHFRLDFFRQLFQISAVKLCLRAVFSLNLRAMFQVGFLGCHPNEDLDVPLDAWLKV